MSPPFGCISSVVTVRGVGFQKRDTGYFSYFRMEDMPVTVKPKIGMDFCFNDVRDVFRWEQLDNLPLQGDGVIISHGSLKALTQDVTDINRKRDGSPGRDRFLGFDAKAFGISGDEAAVKISVGVRSFIDSSEFQFGNETILEGAIDSFTSAACLG